jgi:hypothetical protein
MISKALKYFTVSNLLIVICLLLPSMSYAQYQENIPKPSGPVDLSKTSNVVIFIVIPVIILVLYLIFRRRIGKVKKEKYDRMK